jgi:hypothetical protein
VSLLQMTIHSVRGVGSNISTLLGSRLLWFPSFLAEHDEEKKRGEPRLLCHTDLFHIV